jgi:hypothetical protein
MSPRVATYLQMDVDDHGGVMVELVLEIEATHGELSMEPHRPGVAESHQLLRIIRTADLASTILHQGADGTRRTQG